MDLGSGKNRGLRGRGANGGRWSAVGKHRDLKFARHGLDFIGLREGLLVAGAETVGITRACTFLLGWINYY